MSEFKNFKSESRLNWGKELHNGGTISNEEITLGAILRIADATEAMAKDRVALERDLKYYKDRFREQQATIDQLTKSRNSYKGKFNNLKKKLEEKP